MTIDNQENLIINIDGKTQLFNKEFVKRAIKAQIIEENMQKLKEPKTTCANYERDNEEYLKDSVVEAVKHDLTTRSYRGIQKYNVTLDRKDLKLKDWLNHLYEETLDSANYIKRTLIELENDN